LDTLSIILLTHNRPYQAYEAIRSILAQSDHRFKLIVSDNSSSDELKNLLGADLINLPPLKFKYLKRDKVYSVVDHGNLCLDEVDTSYFCLFHDDDLMLPNFVANFWSALRDYPALNSCGMNAFIEKAEKSVNYFSAL